MTKVLSSAVLALAAMLAAPLAARGQIVEAVGSRALGMGGAFVAVADDGSATWWNPAGLAPGPFFDLGVAAGSTDIDDVLPGRREGAVSVAAGLPPFGVSYYRLRITDIGAVRPIAGPGGGREEGLAAVPAQSQTASQLGATLVHTLFQGVHAGATVKYVRSTGATSDLTGPATQAPGDWLDAAADLPPGDAENGFDVDVGVLAVVGAFRMGGVVRNILETELAVGVLPRQVRLGAAFDAGVAGGWPVLVAVDADAVRYATPFGDRRVVAVGGEGWAFERRLGVRAGARVNTVGAGERAFTGGASVAIRRGVYVDGYIVHGGGTGNERGWGVAARASF